MTDYIIGKRSRFPPETPPNLLVDMTFYVTYFSHLWTKELWYWILIDKIEISPDISKVITEEARHNLRDGFKLTKAR